MNTKRVYYFIGFLLFLSFTLNAQKTMSISSDKQQLIIGDPLSVKINVTYGLEENISFPSFKQIIGDSPFELLKTVSTDTILLDNGEKQFIRELLLTSFEPGQYTLGPVKFPVTNNQTPFDSISSNTIQIKVLPLAMKKDSSEIKPIRDIWNENKNWQDWLPLIYILCGLFILFLIVLWLRKRRKIKIITPEVPLEIVSPVKEALEKMNWLSKQNFLEQKDFVNYHYELGVIFRAFLEKQYEVNLLDLPTAEVLEKIQHLPLASLLSEKMITWMKTVDLVKFAKYEPTYSFHEEAFQEVKQFLTQFLSEESSITSDNK
jgi:hypothetical protein